MNAAEMQVFVDATTHYFTQSTGLEAEVHAPYLSDTEVPDIFDYTGVISVVGEFRGCIYFSAPRAMMRHLLIEMGEQNHSDDYLLDMIGEIANTLSGNARRYFGPEFIISVPVSLKGELTDIRPPSDLRPYVIPVRWKSYRSVLVICVERG
ncbi:chemotaxis protein CheX [Acidihalobacter prosperus]|uniref:Chemotaxis protein CheC n=1 Tax=Acidihalobacter prosperus TaxID=160660 RepID=A0A1A6C085_9GAMM|nr:chemotaxis protein CheX [Acidihalobacter prosperus]OBS07969.1 chemotaxis protein CheC [Acidihalobacter prosperus]